MKKLLLSGALVLGTTVLGGCAAFDSFTKSIESDTKGLPRHIEIYSVTGDLLAEYDGKSVRLEDESEEQPNKVSILVDGKRHSFYNAVVLVEEQ